MVASVLGGFMVMCFCLYTFIPENLRGRTATLPKDGATAARFWGPNDADFDWCEPDYVVLDYVAEFNNTWTNLFYFIPGVIFFCKHTSLTPRGVNVLLFILGTIGVGSAMFHGTLRYRAQLADELPMHWLVIGTAYLLAVRNLQPGSVWKRRSMVIALVLAEVVLTVGLFASDRTSITHNAFRGWLSVTFASGFVSIFFMALYAAREVDAAFSGEKGWEARTAAKLFRTAFFLFVFALSCWICDIMLCPMLHSLPFGIPYPQLHAFCWHGGSAAGVYWLAVIITLRSHADADRSAPKLGWFSGIVPYLIPIPGLRHNLPDV